MVEQRAARIEADESCAVYADRLEALSKRVWWVVTEQLRQHEQGARTAEGVEGTESAVRSLGPLITQLTESVSPGGGLGVKLVGQENGPLQIESVPGGESEASESVEGVEAAIDAGAEATRSALWYLIGMAAGSFVAYAFYRQVMPRA